MFKVALILVTYNGEAYLSKCLQHVSQSSQTFQTYCCDNGSTDNTVAILKKYILEDRLITLSKNIGFGAANNICLKKAYNDGADYFMLINQDVYIRPDTATMLISLLNKYENTGIISPIHFNGNGTIFDKNFLHNFLINSRCEFVNDLYFKKLKPVYQVKFVNAACWMLTRKTIEIVGGFDPLFFHYGEDDNYCQRVLFHGIDIQITTLTSIQHDRDERDGGIREVYLLDQMHRAWLLKISNVLGANHISHSKQLIDHFIKSSARSLLKFKFKDTYKLYRKFLVDKSLLQKAFEHKEKNKKPGLNWLES